jgi:hypothetical protein
MSFLSRFDFAISPQGLTLHGREARPSGRQFDVFISYRSVDSGHAQAVYDVLVGAGHRPFFALASVPGGGRADFGRAIDEAIEEVEHMVVVCSSRENVEAPWVDREWRFYEHLVTSGRKPRGNVVPVLCGGMRPEDLPGPLSRYHAVSLGAPRWQADLLSFVQAR